MGFISVGRRVGSGVYGEKSASVYWRLGAGGLNGYGGLSNGGVWIPSSIASYDRAVNFYHSQAGSQSEGLCFPLWRMIDGGSEIIQGSSKPAAARAACPPPAGFSERAGASPDLRSSGMVAGQAGRHPLANQAPVSSRNVDRVEIPSARRIPGAAANSAGRRLVDLQFITLGFAAQSCRGGLQTTHVQVRDLSTCGLPSAAATGRGGESRHGRFSVVAPGTGLGTAAGGPSARSMAVQASSSSSASMAAAGARSGVSTRAEPAAAAAAVAASTVDLARGDLAAAEDEDGRQEARADSAMADEAWRFETKWAVKPKPVTRADGSPWPWRCFSPKETLRYDSDLPPAELMKHHEPENFGDRFAYRLVKVLRIPTDVFFRKKYGCRAVMLETVAAVPGMVGGMLLHLQSLRRFEHSGGWIRTLLSEAENERMHLMTFMEVSKPRLWERALVMVTQGVFANAFFLLYIISPRVAHRVVGYLEEEAVISYTSYLNEIDAGRIDNTPAPQIAIDYWSLPKDARLRDVVLAVRADEAHHRDVNHFASDIKSKGKELKDMPAPVDYEK